MSGQERRLKSSSFRGRADQNESAPWLIESGAFLFFTLTIYGFLADAIPTLAAGANGIPSLSVRSAINRD